MTDQHTKVFQSQRLDFEFLSKHGFRFEFSAVELGFYWVKYANHLYPMIKIFFNYYADDTVTYEVLFEDHELHNVDKSRFLTLLQMLKPKEDA